ncbi:Sec61beta family protein [Medicago truncatula]|uniref:Sec61beta family protein n=1 Tax=Medicago truncatula TaxID=3880 RepID=G7JYF4_MEDTR|nr:Sec61beta family protein [Medicago truncatula]
MKSGYTIRKIVICHRHEPLENTMHLRGQSPRIPLKKFVFENLIFDRGLLLVEELFQRGSATATASIRRMNVGAFEGVVGTMLHFYVDGALGFKISPIVVLAMSIGFIASFFASFM